jgi:ABC-type multidrug transport system permease subunit
MQVLSRIYPFSYAVHALKVVLLKGAGLGACTYDLLFLTAFTLVAMAFATKLFRRTL